MSEQKTLWLATLEDGTSRAISAGPHIMDAIAELAKDADSELLRRVRSLGAYCLEISSCQASEVYKIRDGEYHAVQSPERTQGNCQRW